MRTPGGLDMANAAVTHRHATPGALHTERRDLTTRALRAAVAAWFGMPPARLASLDDDTIDRMALRLEGRRPRRPLDADNVCPIPQSVHPWAG
jgi:hypothetical protein